LKAPAETEQAPKQAASGHPQARDSDRHLSEQISAALQRQLAAHFEYPWLARKRGWQGEVTLSLRVERDGHLTRWAISETSGHALLDRSALATAKRIGRLPQAAGWLNGRSIDLLLPVSYRLLGS
jgi:protein TonB